MNALNLVTNDRIDGRRAKSWWHEQAKEMKAAGVSLQEIADKFGKTVNGVAQATRGVQSPNLHRPGPREFQGPAAGFSTGKVSRVAISFSSEQVAKINALAEASNKSFSATVCGLVDAAFEETPSEYERCINA